MELLYCGFNGFGQLSSVRTGIVSCLTPFPAEGIQLASLSWSYVALKSDRGIQLSGFVGHRSHQVKCVGMHDSVAISCNRKHMLAVVETGVCWRYCIESGSWRRLDPFTTVEQDIEGEREDDSVVQVCSGATFDASVSESGRAFIMPSPIYNPGTKVTQVACGNEHCLLVTEIGEVFSWGIGSRGQLGHSDLENEDETARQVDVLAGLRVTRVAAGGWHSAAVTDSGDLYTWGWNNSGQLGFPTCAEEQQQCDKSETCSTEAVSILNFPLPVNWDKTIMNVGCGSRHTVVLLDDGSVWGCGWNAFGQLGTSPKTMQSCWKMHKLELPSKCVAQDVLCGAWSTMVFTIPDQEDKEPFAGRSLKRKHEEAD
ncbi:RCC1 domain-containing protein 1 [Periplaneta americana]|uniref:RCC1 domain-containing protein 1 n=1 Tax=Periplaneta americana TaxID=6978 RepID=UPI0037E71DEE